MGGIFALKVCVYAICKNESQFADRFMDSMSEADYVCVLDTGSSDDTVKKLRARGAIVGETVVSPWRFDTARNESLGLIPADADICCAIDLDEQPPRLARRAGARMAAGHHPRPLPLHLELPLRRQRGHGVLGG